MIMSYNTTDSHGTHDAPIWNTWFTLLAPTGALIVMMVYYTTYNIDAIDVTSVTLSRLNSIYQCIWCHKMQINADGMS